jgi:hypothetical protein
MQKKVNCNDCVFHNKRGECWENSAKMELISIIPQHPPYIAAAKNKNHNCKYYERKQS